MTPVHVRDATGGGAVAVAFLESARFYRLPRSHPRFDSILRDLHNAIETREPCRVRLASIDGDVIEDVERNRPSPEP